MQGTIREARPVDVPGLEVVRRQALEHGLTDAYERSTFADLVACPDEGLREHVESSPADTLVLVVETDVTLACYGVYDRDRSEIQDIYTAPDFERHGCAAAVVDRFRDAARDDDCTTIEAVTPHNAVGFFESQGFVRQGPDEWRGLRGHRLVTRLG